MERIGECLWPTEKLSAADVTGRLALTQLLWAESERNMVESVRDVATIVRNLTPPFLLSPRSETVAFS